jgi:hypothetical protein
MREIVRAAISSPLLFITAAISSRRFIDGAGGIIMRRWGHAPIRTLSLHLLEGELNQKFSQYRGLVLAPGLATSRSARPGRRGRFLTDSCAVSVAAAGPSESIRVLGLDKGPGVCTGAVSSRVRVTEPALTHATPLRVVDPSRAPVPDSEPALASTGHEAAHTDTDRIPVPPGPRTRPHQHSPPRH